MRRNIYPLSSGPVNRAARPSLSLKSYLCSVDNAYYPLSLGHCPGRVWLSLGLLPRQGAQGFVEFNAACQVVDEADEARERAFGDQLQQVGWLESGVEGSP